MVSIIYKDERPGPTKKWLDPLGFGGKFIENITLICQYLFQYNSKNKLKNR